MLRARRPLVPATLLLAVLAGCGPIPVAQAERQCVESARLAKQPRGTIATGIGVSNGEVRPVGRVEVSVSSDYVMGRDPSDVFNRCVMNRSGQMPTVPLYDQPGWRG